MCGSRLRSLECLMYSFFVMLGVVSPRTETVQIRGDQGCCDDNGCGTA